MIYGWTKEEVDKLYLFDIHELCKQIYKLPSADLILFGMMKGDRKPIGQQVGSLGIPVKKGKVMRRPHGGTSGRTTSKTHSGLRKP